MRRLRLVILGTLLAGVAAVSVSAPAQAASTASAATIQVQIASPVTGQSWSAPTFPVTCAMEGDQVSCTPDSAVDIKDQRCFIGVLVAGSNATVCTTYEGHQQQLKDAGGKELTVDYGCSMGDLVCVTFENAGRGMALATTGALFLMETNIRFDTSSTLWNAAVSEWSFWNWAVLAVVFTAMVWAVAAAAISRDRDELVGAIIRSFIAIPAVPLTLWMTGHVVNAVDELVMYSLNRDGRFAVVTTLQSVMWAGGQANYFFAFLIHGLLLLAIALLTLVFAFRNLALAVLIMVGPVAWMLFPVRGLGPQWVVRYVSAVVVLLLTGPLTIGFLALIINGLASVRTIWDPQSWPLLVGLVLIAFAPFAIFGLFTFTGAVAADSLGSRLGGQAGHIGSNAVRGAARLPSRLGGAPAGVTPGSARGSGVAPSSGAAGGGSPSRGSARANSPSSGTAGAGSPGGSSAGGVSAAAGRSSGTAHPSNPTAPLGAKLGEPSPQSSSSRPTASATPPTPGASRPSRSNP
ncbi:hypothetical protein M4I32_12420 [Microbacterium sp. LRZ72]|uniref:hypothetical protein n=1 Tax=Microbacterium sp. LRZ72 TaxID=2942481 RepID=UPI0029AD1099|nr:hypothetical protein [Microbacterium sp. LRZ72]MDX2377605.1 hypothetical protein [Microbacterium sp. LRZ72]